MQQNLRPKNVDFQCKSVELTPWDICAIFDLLPDKNILSVLSLFTRAPHCKYLNAWFEGNGIVISVYSHYPLDPNAKSSNTKGNTFSIRWFCIRIERVDCIRKLGCHCIQILYSDIYSVRILFGVCNNDAKVFFAHEKDKHSKGISSF